MIKHQCLKFVFSSTAAVFGEPTQSPIPVDERTLPINPYGESKLVVEKLLKSCDHAYGLKHVALRYFNACGAAKGGHIGEDHEPETHLIPLILQVFYKRETNEKKGSTWKA
jgi:UDP-glucose 4-epimerase